MTSILANGQAAGTVGMIVWLVVLFAVMYFLMIRPQKKEQKKKELMLNEVATGDTVLTTSGFYGTVIDIEDDTVIVEFGNNKNCRIPMQKAAIADLVSAMGWCVLPYLPGDAVKIVLAAVLTIQLDKRLKGSLV